MSRVSVALLVLSTGCAHFSGRAPGSLTSGFSYEARLWLMDAEEDLAAARLRVEETDRDVKMAHLAVAEAERRADELAGLDKALREEAEAQVRFSLAAESHAVADHELAEDAADCARARFELAKVEVARKVRMSEASEVSPEPFQAAVDKCEDELSAKREQVRVLLDARASTKNDWERRKAQAAARYGLLRPGPFVE